MTRELGRRLRLQMTPSEVTLWRILKNRQLDGLKFRRQYAIEGYILDFYCPQLALGIELDGQVHMGRDEEDDIRSCRLQEAKGISILRYENRVVENILH